MANFDAQVRESQSQVAEAQTKIAELTGRIETARAKLKIGDGAMVDIENASLDDVHAHTDVMHENIIELLLGLDDVISSFSKNFDEMCNKTGRENFVGNFFARNQTVCAKSVCALPRSTTHCRTLF